MYLPIQGPLRTEEYRCDECGEIYGKGWSDEEVLEELKVNFNVPVEECGLVCDDCYKKFY